jgi:CHAT domain-containing protein/Tfp pilus assembly protein PilF
MSLTLPVAKLYVCARESVRGSTRQVLLLVLIAVAIISSPDSRSSSSAQTPPRLIPGESISQDIAPGSVQTFEADLKEGECLHLLLKKNDLRLLVTVQDPTGKTSDLFVGVRFEPLQVLKIAANTGLHVVSVRSLENQAGPHQYELFLDAVRRATTADYVYETALKTENEAEVARLEWQESSLRRAIKKYFEASEAWKSISQYHEAAGALSSTGEIYSILSEYDLATVSYEQALALNRTAGDRSGEINSLNNLANAHLNLNHYDRALGLLSQSRQLSEDPRFANTPEYKRYRAQTFNNFGEVSSSRGELQAAFDYFNQALALWTETNDRYGQSLAYLNLGYTFYDSGDIPKASTNYQNALNISRAIGDRRGEALARTAMGGVYAFQGEKQLALDSHNEALKLFQSIGDHLGQASTLNGVGTAYEELNENQIALTSYTRARELFHGANKVDLEAVSDYYLGKVHRSLDQIPKALSFYNECIKLSQRAGNPRVEAYALKDIALIYNSLGQRRKALGQFERVLAIYESSGDKRGEAYTLHSIGYTWYLTGNIPAALKFFNRALPLSKSMMDRPAEVSILYNLALAERTLGELPNALAYIQESTHLIESMRTKVLNRDLRASYFASVHQHYELYIDLLMKLEQAQPNNGYVQKAFEISEQARARSLLDSLTEGKFSSDPSASLSNRLGELRQALNAKMEYQMRLLDSNAAPELANQANEQIQQLNRDYDKFEAQLKTESKQFAALTEPQEMKLQGIQAQIADGNSLLLEFQLGTERSYLWTVSADSIKAYELLDRNTLEQLASKVHELLIARQPIINESPRDYQDRVTGSDAQYLTTASKLSWLLLGKIKDQLGDKRLLIVADGELHYVPFDALPIPVEDQSISTLDYVPLVVNHEIVKLPSASVLAAVRQSEGQSLEKTIALLADPVFDAGDPRITNSSTTTPLAIAQKNTSSGAHNPLQFDRLPSTLREAQTVLEMLPAKQGALFSGVEASRELALGSALHGYKIIHFGTHALMDPEHPETSGIMLSFVDRNGNPQDGVLRIADIYDLRLATDLVVLSACQTAVGKNVKGEGLMGLARSFLFAGSKSVLATLWEVDDEATTELIKHFYHGLLIEHLPASVALKNAKLFIRSQKRWQPPYFWAGFELQGEYRKPISVPAARRYWLYLLGSALVAICLLSGYYVFRYLSTHRIR